MSTITITEISESNNEPNDNIVEGKVDELGEETDAENSEEDKKENASGIKKKKKKVRRELSTRENKNDCYSSSEEFETHKNKTKKESSIIVKRRKKVDSKDEIDRNKRGKSEPKELKEDIESNKTKKTWWPWARSKMDNRQVQTDGETRSRRKSDSSDEFWKSSSFRQRRKNKSDTKNKSETNVCFKKEKIAPLVSKEILTDEITVEIINEPKEPNPEVIIKKLTWKQFKIEYADEYRKLTNSRNRCISLLIALLIYLGLGALSFRFIEGAFENFYKCGVKRVKRDFIDTLWDRRYANEDEWKSIARRTLLNFENELHVAFEAGLKSYSGQQSWSFINAFVYCLTVVTTIGYGNISPSTHTGRAFTIAYAIFGIPLFLIVLADFGKMFTRGIKFLWAYVRRVYYTGSCRKVRRTVPVQEVMKGVKMVYDVASNLRRPSQVIMPDEDKMTDFAKQLETPGTGAATPALSAYEIDEEFNLPISLALLILLGYIFCGATVFCIWENWSFFESFYFVFISMSTIGFGDVVPQHQMYMMASIVYLLFGLALTSMCINVVQEKLSDSFRQASAKLGATIGFQVEEDTGCVNPIPAPITEMPEVHKSSMKSKKS